MHTVHVMNLTEQDQHGLQFDPSAIPSPQFRFRHTFNLPLGHTIMYVLRSSFVRLRDSCVDVAELNPLSTLGLDARNFLKQRSSCWLSLIVGGTCLSTSKVLRLWVVPSHAGTGKPLIVKRLGMNFCWHMTNRRSSWLSCHRTRYVTKLRTRLRYCGCVADVSCSNCSSSCTSLCLTTCGGFRH